MKRTSPLALTLTILASSCLLLVGCEPAQQDYPAVDTNAPVVQPPPTNTLDRSINDPADRTPAPPPAP